MKAVEISRQQLYNQVWAEPMIKVARKYGISDVGLAKIGRRNNIPVPPRGFWAQKHAGYKVQVIPLPRQKYEPTITINPQAAANTVSLSQSPNTALAFKSPLVVPETLTDPHPLTAKSETVLTKRRAGENGLIGARSLNSLDIMVSPDRVPRALRIFDTIIKALEFQGIEVLISESGTSILANGIQVFFGLGEELKAIPREPTKWERKIGRTDVYTYVPSGDLLLSIKDPEVYSARKNWRDGKKKLEEKLANFVVRLINHSVLAKKQEEERLERERRWEEERRKRIEREEKARIEKEKFSQLMAFIQNWHQSNLIRQFADAVEEKVRNSALSVDKGWLTWVREQADRLDPLIPGPSSSDDEE